MHAQDQLCSVELVLDEMEAVLTAFGSKMEQFWLKKKEALSGLQSMPSGLKKTQLWKRYKDLSSKASQLVKFRDVEASFQVDQIRTCIHDLQEGWNSFDSLKAKVETKVLMPYLMGRDNLLKDYRQLYTQMQALAPFVYRLPLLRKDLLAIDGPFSAKKKVFSTLSLLADEVFAKKQQIINELQPLIKEDIESLEKKIEGADVKLYLKLFKSLQFITKQMPLPQSSYQSFRKQFSVIWDKLSVMRQAYLEQDKQKQEEEKKEEQEAKEKSLSQEKKKIERKQSFEKLVDALNVLLESKKLDLSAVDKLVLKRDQFTLDFKERFVWQVLGHRLASARIALEPSGDEYALRNKLALRLKKEIDLLRKEMGAASIDIEKGLVYQEQKALLLELFEVEVAMINKIRGK